MTYCRAQGTLLSVNVDGRRVWGRMDACICMIESLPCSPETDNIVNHLYPNTKIKVKKKKKEKKFSSGELFPGKPPPRSLCAAFSPGSSHLQRAKQAC